MNILEDLKSNFKQGNMLTKLIFINVGVFLLAKIIIVIGNLSQSNFEYYILEYFAMPSGARDFLFRFWTAITYMFLHTGFLHLLFNMLWLYWMGKIFIDLLNGRRLLAVYLLGGFSGALLYMLVYNLLGYDSHPLLGASAGVMSVVIATAVYFPNYTIYLMFIGPVKLKYLGAAAIVLDVITLDDGNFGGHIAHFGGEIFGFIWASKLKNGTDIAKGFSNFCDSFFSIFKPKSKVKVHYRNESGSSRTTNQEKSNAVSQKEIDIILDKIAKSGYNSLTKEEKEVLFKMSSKK
ncbi:MAG: rhomboid family intramembrane serine protease [Bacteroidales bacterium]|nr:rhomboid family intramembrane serine protease [Bacteroidales bacterium]